MGNSRLEFSGKKEIFAIEPFRVGISIDIPNFRQDALIGSNAQNDEVI
jgi:hypothetical protein